MIDRNQRKHFRVAQECIRKEMRRFAFDAHAYERGMLDGPHARNAYEQYQKMQAALEYFKQQGNCAIIQTP